MHQCLKIAMEEVIKSSLDLSALDRGYTSSEIAVALRSLGYGMTIYENVSTVELPFRPESRLPFNGSFRKEFYSWVKKHNLKLRCVKNFDTGLNIDPEDYGDCVVEISRHAIAYVDGCYYDNGTEIAKPDQILSVWVPYLIKST